VLARASKLDAEGAGRVEAIESTDPVAAERTTMSRPLAAVARRRQPRDITRLG